MSNEKKRVADPAIEERMDNLDPEDQAIEDSITEEVLNAPVNPSIEELRKEAKQIARNTIKHKKMQLTIRPQAGDIDKIKLIADRLGMPFHTYINSIIHLAAKGEIGLDFFAK